ncbi:MAG TPA: cupin domain-containing protein [Candidatus Nanoarchaeia archaeon]|nr:cupin domain-containing protein [Candidatus Nanoarchaeia archaeon]
MKIISQKESSYVSKPEGINVWYYIRDEYELHYSEQLPNSSQKWHHHEKILETFFLVEGELTVEWKENGKINKQIIKKGDFVETEKTPHTFVNHTNRIAKVVVIKQVLSGKNNKELFKTDKILD